MGKHSNEWRTRLRYLGTGPMGALDAEPWAIGLTVGEAVKTSARLQDDGVKMVAVFSDSQAAIRRMAHLEPGPGRRVVRWIDRGARAHLAHGIATEFHSVLGLSSFPGNEEADRQPNLTRDAGGGMAMERPYNSASNRA